ncbi:hypothetical protein [Pedobacter cryotolerans]|uniref:Uncharacterized protein n=1 Tax=Pedobacter cryotolerans TaxID=2571270 RepID=A0A4U1BYC6_9SPHI|nr:hypothetical protein [Pedobacter cryotolerans]TKB98031.1 hypothetical protein FA045_15315 [Pedobacter cryotolerans]
MKKYARISCGFTSTGAISGLDEDAVVTEDLNLKLEKFLKKNKIKDFRIINAETVIVPKQDFTHNYNLVCLHLEYEI